MLKTNKIMNKTLSVYKRAALTELPDGIVV